MEIQKQLLNQTKIAKLETIEVPNPTMSLAKQGTLNHSVISVKFPTDCWIIDTGALDHMTRSPEVLSTYEPCSQGLTIPMANGTTTIAQEKGATSVASLNLKLVLYVPNLKCNLILVSKLTKEEKCLVTIFPFYCELQDLSSEKTIGNAKKKGGLYYISKHE